MGSMDRISTPLSPQVVQCKRVLRTKYIFEICGTKLTVPLPPEYCDGCCIDNVKA